MEKANIMDDMSFNSTFETKIKKILFITFMTIFAFGFGSIIYISAI